MKRTFAIALTLLAILILPSTLEDLPLQSARIETSSSFV
jgi:hypothetical protein